MKDKSKRLMGMNVYITRTQHPEKYQLIMYMPCIPYVGKSRFCLKHGNHSLKLMRVNQSKKTA